MTPVKISLPQRLEFGQEGDSEERWKLFKQISKATKLSYYDPTKEFILENDASDYGLGTAVMQEGKPIAYGSRALSDPAQIEKEMLGVVFGLEKIPSLCLWERGYCVHRPQTPCKHEAEVFNKSS